MKSNLALIGDSVLAAAEEQLRAPVVSPQEVARAANAAQKKVAGFVLHRSSIEKGQLTKARNRRVAAIEAYKTDSAALTDSLATVGITPLAVLPVGAWDRICDRTKLIRLNPDASGTVMIDDTIAKGASVFARWMLQATAIVTGLAVALVAGTIMATLVGPWFWMTAVAWFCFVATRHTIHDDFAKPISKFWARLYVRQKTLGKRTSLLYRLFPNCKEPVSSSIRATIALPQPPADVQQILMQAHGRSLKVALVPDALDFAEPIEKILLRDASTKIDARIERERAEYLAWLEKDPIIYETNGSAVAIIAQFGEFPIEQQVVDEIVNSHQLIL